MEPLIFKNPTHGVLADLHSPRWHKVGLELIQLKQSVNHIANFSGEKSKACFKVCDAVLTPPKLFLGNFGLLTFFQQSLALLCSMVLAIPETRPAGIQCFSRIVGTPRQASHPNSWELIGIIGSTCRIK